MKMFLTVVAFCLPALGQAVYSGSGSYLGPAISNGSNCASPNYCAYNGVDLIPAGTPPNVSNSDGTNNGATVYDTTFLGHTNFDGSTFSNPAYLSPVTRLTDVNSSPALCNAYTAGECGSGAVTAVNTNTSLVAVTCNGSEFVGLFNASGPNKGHFTPIHSGVLITRDLCVAGCVSGTSSQTEDFGATVFSHTDPNTLFSFGINNSEITTATTVCPYSINPATGAYSLLTCLVDFKYGLPQYSAPQWAASTNYAWGDYVIHTLSSAEMATGGVWTTGHTYALGDIVGAQGGSIACMYVLVTASGTATTGTPPSFINGNGGTVCKTDALTDATGNKWRGTSSTAQSCVGGCDHGSFHGCGKSYNYANLGPAFNTWQNIETCWPTGTVYPASSLPGTSAGPVSQFTHTNATGTCGVFSCQFQISEWSQDGNWLFWSSDWGCQLGSTTGSAPVVWSSGSYYQAFIQPSVPSGLASLCGYPWIPGTSYVSGNTITPIEGTTGIGAIDDVFQALTNGMSGPNSSVGSNQPACLQYMNVAGVWTANAAGSCFAGTNPPSMTALTVTAASESGTTGTIVVSNGVALNAGAQVTLAGFSPAGWNGTFSVTGAVGANCPGTNCAAVTSFQLAGLPSGLSAVTTLGTAASEGDRVCDSPSDNGSGSVNSFNPSNCSVGVMWQDLGPQTQRGDVFAVNLGNQL